MADRAGYSIPADRLPKGTDEGHERGIIMMPSLVGYLFLAGTTLVGVSCGFAIGAVPWGVTGALPLVVGLASVWIASVAAASLASNGRMTPLGLVFSLLVSAGAVGELTRVLLPAMSMFAERGEYVWMLLLLFLVVCPVVAAPLSIRRMRETLWQDVNWSLMDVAFYSFGIVKGSYVLSHIGDSRHDRYASVEVITRRATTRTDATEEVDRDFFMVDKMLGRIAHTGDSHEEAESVLSQLGYDIEHVRDMGGTVRIHEYAYPSGRTGGDLRFELPPARGISAAEYYHRM